MRGTNLKGQFAKSFLRSVMAVLLGVLITAATSHFALAEPASGIGSVAQDAEDHLVRHCEAGSKQEHCYWTKTGSQHTPAR